MNKVTSSGSIFCWPRNLLEYSQDNQFSLTHLYLLLAIWRRQHGTCSFSSDGKSEIPEVGANVTAFDVQPVLNQ